MAATGLERALRDDRKTADQENDVAARCRVRAKKILDDLRRTNPKQAALVTDPNSHIAALCPRRAGKTYGGVAMAMVVGEAAPGSITLVISLNSKQLRRLYWRGAPAGIFTFNRNYNLGLKTNDTHLRWEHENGSTGYLMGVDGDEEVESIRGLEADLYLIDESSIIPPGRLHRLITEILEPQAASRSGRIVMIGTPGVISTGPFYEATCDKSRSMNDEGRSLPTSVLYGTKDPFGRDPIEHMLWSRHHWTLEDNRARPQQWVAAVRKKKARAWADDHPTWLREYLGLWTESVDGLVYRYALEKGSGTVTWVPAPEKGNPAGLPPEGAPWRFVGGLDLGFEAPTAFVLAAYSRRTREFRHVTDWSYAKLHPSEIAEKISESSERYGRPEVIYCDAGNLGRMILETLKDEYGIPVERAQKRDKHDWISLANEGFARGEIKIIESTLLSEQLISDVWDLGDDSVEDLARVNKLVEDKSVPNDSCDAFLYALRGAYHRFKMWQSEEILDVDHPDYAARWEAEQLRKYRARKDLNVLSRASSTSHLSLAPDFVRDAFGTSGVPWKTSTRKS
jgi:hypothetical protein